MSSMPDLEKEFIEYVVKTLVTKPDAVSAVRDQDERGDVIKLTVDPVDMGKVIGRAGATAKSLRTLLRAMSATPDSATRLKIVEPEGEATPVENERHAKARQEIAELGDLEV